MAVHLQGGEVVVDPTMRGEAEPCGFCGRSMAWCHPTVPPNTLDLPEWVIASRDDAKKKERAKRIPVVMKPKITLKVAHAVDSQATSYSEASLSRSDWEWKPKEDSSSAESGCDSSSGN